MDLSSTASGLRGTPSAYVASPASFAHSNPFSTFPGDSFGSASSFPCACDAGPFSSQRGTTDLTSLSTAGPVGQHSNMQPPRAAQDINALNTDMLNAQDDIRRLHDKVNVLSIESQNIIDNQKAQAGCDLRRSLGSPQRTRRGPRLYESGLQGG